MLILSRHAQERIMIGSNIEVVVTRIVGNRVELGIAAPREVPIIRGPDRKRTPPGPEDLGEVAVRVVGAGPLVEIEP